MRKRNKKKNKTEKEQELMVGMKRKKKKVHTSSIPVSDGFAMPAKKFICFPPFLLTSSPVPSLSIMQSGEHQEASDVVAVTDDDTDNQSGFLIRQSICRPLLPKKNKTNLEQDPKRLLGLMSTIMFIKTSFEIS